MKVEPYDPRSWIQLYHRPTWVARLIQFVYLFLNYGECGLNPPCFEYIYHGLLPLTQNLPFFSWTSHFLYYSNGMISVSGPLTSKNALASLYDSQSREPKMEFLMWSNMWPVSKKTRLAPPFSQMVCLCWSSLCCLSTKPSMLFFWCLFCAAWSPFL